MGRLDLARQASLAAKPRAQHLVVRVLGTKHLHGRRLPVGSPCAKHDTGRSFPQRLLEAVRAEASAGRGQRLPHPAIIPGGR